MKFGGENFFGWKRAMVMVLGAKFKLGFVDGIFLKSEVILSDYQRWIRADYMVICWIFEFMMTELSDVFVYI